FVITSAGANTFTYTNPVTGLANSSGGTAFIVLPALSATLTATGATESGNTVTISTTAPHGFVAGQNVAISGVPVPGYNGTFLITSVTPTSFTYTNPASGLVASGGGTAAIV